MNRIMPQIYSGKFELLLTETLCFNPLDGVKISIPTLNDRTGKQGSDITFNFIFQYDKEQEDRNIHTSIDKNQIDILLHNFGDTLISGTPAPITFQFGSAPIRLFFSGMLLKDNEAKLKVLNFTVSIYQGKIE